jgi:hypothetical protein
VLVHEGENARQVYDRVREYLQEAPERLANYQAAQAADGPGEDYSFQIASHESLVAAGAESALPPFRAFAGVDDAIRPF